MQKNFITKLFFAVCLMTSFFSTQKAQACGNTPSKQLTFIENKGQWNDPSLFRTELQAGKLFVEPTRLTYLLINPLDIEEMHRRKHDLGDPLNTQMDMHAFRINFAEANEQPILTPSCKHSSYNNYFIGKNPQNWKGHVSLFEEVQYENLYNGINMRLYSNDGNIKYDFIVSPNTNPNAIKLQYSGTDNLYIENENLHIVTSVNKIIEQKPFAYQYINGVMQTVACNFLLSNKTITFEFPNGYDNSKELIIDPELVFSTYSGSVADNWGMTATPDLYQNFFGGGIAFGAGYPTTEGAFSETFEGLSIDIALTKFNSVGTDLLYSTYLGGGNSNEVPHSIIVNSKNQLVVYGTTGSNDYPTTSNAYSQNFNGGENVNFSGINYAQGSDIVVSIFSEDGSSLVSSTYLGGFKNDGLNMSNILSYNYADEARGEVYLDKDDNVYIATSTFSPDLPVTADSPQPIFDGQNGTQDACALKLSADLSEVLWGTYIGGTNDDAGYSIKVDDEGYIYVAGGSNSEDLPTTEGVIKPLFSGGLQPDGFLVKAKPGFDYFVATTYLGTVGYNQAYFVDLDSDGNVYALGQTKGNYPVVNAGYSVANSGQFVHKLNNDFTETLFSTIFGSGDGDPDISPSAFLVDYCGQIFISGWGSPVGNTLSTTGLPTTPGAYDITTDGQDFYLMALDQNANELLYATFFGGSQGFAGEHVDGGTSRFDRSGIIYQSVCASCGQGQDFPTTSGAWSNSNNSSNCNMGSFKFSFEIAPTIAEFTAPTSGCAPFAITIQNSSVNVDTYKWDFGDGTSSTANTLTLEHTYNEPGTYNIKLIVFKEGTCNHTDTLTKTIFVNNPELPAFDAPQFCEGAGNVTLTANPAGGVWSGQGIIDNESGLFKADIVGTYPITYTINKNSDCEKSITKNVIVNAAPNANFTVPSTFFCSADNQNYELTPITQGGIFVGTGVDGNIFNVGNVPENLYNQFINITYTVSVAGCENSSTQQVYIQKSPNAAFEGAELCTNDNGIQLQAETQGGAWFGTGINNTGFFDPQGLSAGEYTISYTVSNNNCNDTQQRTVKLNAAPEVLSIGAPQCNNDGTPYFTVTLNIQAENSVVILSDGDIAVGNGNNTTATIFQLQGTGETYTLKILDNVTGCSTIFQLLSPVCPDCTGEAGIMPTAQQVVCHTGTVSATSAGYNLGDQQIIAYALHKAPANVVTNNNVLGWNTSGSFTFADLTNAQYNKEYYISAVVGVPNNNNLPDLNHNCTVYNEGTPVVFLAPLKFDLDEHCDFKETGDFSITAFIKGGLPQYNPNEQYMVTGDFAGSLSYAETFTIVLPEDAPDSYQFFAVDQLGCATDTTREFYCEKTPVTLLSFTGETLTTHNLLKWTTASETQVSHFEIQRSTNGTDFETIGTTKATGNTTTAQKYTYADNYTEQGLAYYRLKTIDQNQQVSQTSNVITLNRQTAQNQNFNLTTVQCLPNTNTLKIWLQNNTNAQNATFTIFDISGKQVTQTKMTLKKGADIVEIPTQDFTKGVYLLQVISPTNAVINTKFVY